jgi:hypothetical protein
MCPNHGILNVDTGLCNQTLAFMAAIVTTIVVCTIIYLLPEERF